MVSHEADAHQMPDRHKREVTVVVDGRKYEVAAGKYVVAEFKTLVGVPPAKELDEVIDGKLTPLADDSTINIKSHEVFISHERTGGAS